jgi:transposase
MRAHHRGSPRTLGYIYLIPEDEETRGHGTTGMAKFYKRQLRNFLESLPIASLRPIHAFEQARREANAEAVIPSIPARSRTIPYDKHIYGERTVVERFFNKIKHFRRIATRYEKTALSFASMLLLIGAMIWLR